MSGFYSEVPVARLGPLQRVLEACLRAAVWTLVALSLPFLWLTWRLR